MGTLTIRNVEDSIHDRLRQIAAANGRSVEAEVRHILADAVRAPKLNFLLQLREEIGNSGADLPIPPRTKSSRRVDFS